MASHGDAGDDVLGAMRGDCETLCVYAFVDFSVESDSQIFIKELLKFINIPSKIIGDLSVLDQVPTRLCKILPENNRRNWLMTTRVGSILSFQAISMRLSAG